MSLAIYTSRIRMELDERETMGVKTADPEALGKVSFFLRKADRSHES